MKKSKHFRKDVIMARVIAGLLVILLIALLVFAVSLLTKPSGSNKDTQNTQSTQSTQDQQDLEPDVDISTEPEFEPAPEPEPEADSEGQTADKVYVSPTSQIRFRKEPNTECATIQLVDPGVKMELLEELDGWYKVIYDGNEGYVSADYVEVVEE